MDNLAVMAPSTPSVSNELVSDESESESISLDLHVSDTDDPTESTKNLLESEDEILNKFVDDDKNIKTKVNGIINSLCTENIDEPDVTVKDGQDKPEEWTHVNGKSPTSSDERLEIRENEDQHNKEHENNGITSNTIEKIDDKISNCKELDKDKLGENIEDNVTEEDVEIKTEDDKMEENTNNKSEEMKGEENKEIEENTVGDRMDEKQENKTVENSDDQSKDKKCDIDNKVSSDTNECEVGKDDDEEEDLLQVMETTFDEDQKDENSCSSLSEKENDELDNKEEIEDNQEELDNLNAEIEEANLEEDQDNEESMQIDDDGNHDNEDSNHETGESNKEHEENAVHEETVTDDNDFVEESTKIVQGNSDDGIVKDNGDTEDEETKTADIESKELTKDSAADDDLNDCPMDIEENDIGGVIISEKPPTVEKAMDVDVDANKENENVVDTHANLTEITAQQNKTPSISGDDVVTLIDDDVTDDKELRDTQKKSTKRKQCDKVDDVSHKKLKLEPRDEVKVQRQIEALKSFKEYMRENKLKVLTRHDLEEFCLQKMCEWLIDKSELAEARQKVKVLEQTLDNWRKEAVTVAKQTRDLKIVHDRVTADLKLMKEQTGKPLVPVKITRSVGLQAVMDINIRRPSLPNAVAPNVRVAANNNTNNNTNNNSVANNVRNTANNAKTPVRQHVPAVTNSQPKPSPQRVQTVAVGKPLQPITSKDNSRGPLAAAGAPSPKVINQQTPPPGTATSRKSTEAPKAVIDLTDDEDKANTQPVAPSVTLTPSNRGRVNGQSPVKTATITTTNGPTKHVMLMPTSMLTSRPVMLKVNSNLVSAANSITIPTSQVSIVTTQSKNGQQVRVPVTSITSIRQTSTPKFKHPAPLPLPPPSQHHITAGRKPLPPRPILNLTRSSCGTGIVLQWKMPYQLEQYEAIISYQLYAYQETKTPPRTDNWGKIGDVKALELPMAVTLTQFAVGNRYFFAVRAVDSYKRLGPFSDPQTILL